MDINEMFNNEDKNEQIKPTLDEIKKIVDNKRKNKPNKDLTEQRLKNLELAREKRKIMNQNKKTNAPIPAPIPESIPAPIPESIQSVENNLINELKNMILKQNEILEKLNIEPKKKIKKETKKKIENKTLDLTISDKEIKNIIDANNNSNNINNNINDKKNIEDPKLKVFLEALKKF
jgi:hypothetical protein